MTERFVASRFVAKSRTDVDVGYAQPQSDHAGLGIRSVAYLVDSLVLFGFAAVFFAVGGLNVYLRTDAGRADASDGAIWAFVVIAMATVPSWLFFNLVLDLCRGQSIGQYVLGLRVTRDDGRPAGVGRHCLHWLALHPLLFHPLLAVFWLLLGYVSVSLLESEAVVIASLSLAILCLLAPLAALFFALGDSQRRGLHDWIAGTKVVRIE